MDATLRRHTGRLSGAQWGEDLVWNPKEVRRMRRYLTRAVSSGCALSTAVIIALAAPGAASATLGAQCSGSTVTGQGANVAKIAFEKVWGPDFNTSTNAAACKGSGPVVNYTSTGSGAGLESWGVNGHTASFAPSNAYVVTEEPPNSTQTPEIDKGKGNTVETIPVFQEAIAVLVHLPAGCTATSTSNPGRLVLNNKPLEAVFRGEINTWGALVTANTGSGDALIGSGCAEAAITRVVRLGPEGAGSTHILKKYLYLINPSSFETEKGETKNWNEVAEGTENATWPKAAAVTRPTKTGDTAQIAKIAETPSSIGFGSLANSRANAAFIPGANTATFWTPIENNGSTTKKPKYKDPSTTGEESATAANANCAKTKYTNGVTKFPPKSTLDTWSEVTTATKETNYPICGIGYLLTLKGYADYPSTELTEATTVENFATFVVTATTGGGQEEIENHDYEPLTASLDKEALKGAKETTF